jgi:hypothetical protein
VHHYKHAMTYPSIITPPYGVVNQDNYDAVNDP